ncbi:nucleoside kinase [Syntrophomonas erecta]
MAIADINEQNQIEIRVDGVGTYNVPAGTTAGALAAVIQEKISQPVMAVIIKNELIDLYHELDQSCDLQIVGMDSEPGLQIYRRSASFLLIKAAQDVFPDQALVIRHSLSNGLYCEFADWIPSEQEIKLLEQRMQELVEKDLPIRKKTVDREEACRIFKQQDRIDKVNLLKFRCTEQKQEDIYELDGFHEYFYGYMLPRTSMTPIFRLLPYPPGFIMQTPEKEAPETLRPYIAQPKLANVFHEAKEWSDMLAVPHVASLNQSIILGEVNDIIRVNEALHEKKIAFIADQICKNPQVRLVLISGPSSSGKTTFAQRLLIQLRVNGRKPVSISLDNYFIDRDKTPLDDKGEYDFEALEALKLDLFNEHLQRLINGEKVEIPIYNFKKGTTEPQGMLVRVPAGEPIIIEGIHGLNDRLTWLIPPEQKFKIYISALTQLNIDSTNRIPTTDCRLIRRMVRDARTRGYGALSTIKRWPSVRAGEEKNIFPFQEQADVMFNSSLVYELSILKGFVQPLLEEIGPENPEYMEAQRLLSFLSYFRTAPVEQVPPNSILREFVGGSWFKN